MLKNQHPELKPDEIFLTNAKIGEGVKDVYYWEDLKTKRTGIVAYDHFGMKIRDQYPIFIKMKEAEEKKLVSNLQSA